MADLPFKQSTMPVTLVDEVTGLSPDIVLDGGVNKLRALADVTVNSLRGFDPIADTWFFIGTENNSTGAGGIGDTVRVQIAAGDNVSLFPAVDVTSTLTATEAGDEDALANLIVSDLNGDSNFNLRFFAQKVNKRATLVYISAKEPGPQGERPNVDDFQVTTTGTTVATRAFQNIIRRQKNTSLARDPSDPTLGVLGISGSVSASEGPVSGRFVTFALNTGSPNLLVDGSVTPVDFFITSLTTEKQFVTSIRFSSQGNGIKFGQFLSKNVTLTNGILVTIRSNNSEFTLPAITKTGGFLNEFALGPDNFNIYVQAGGDQMRATLTFPAPIEIAKTGTFATDDFIRIRIQDDLTSGISSLMCRAFGFKREF